MSKAPLSAISYYGGKARMANWIADRLNYSDTSIYVEPFGGGARVLLNKKPHPEEYYNDWGSGVVEFITMLSEADKAEELIDALYETEYSQVQFNAAKEIFDISEEDWLRSARENLIKFLIENKLHNQNRAKLNMLIDAFLAYMFQDNESASEVVKDFKAALSTAPQAVQDNFTAKLTHLYQLAEVSKSGNLFRPRDMEGDSSDKKDTITDLQLAVATYIVFTQSRDAMGAVWSEKKMTQAVYHKRISRLYDCAKRLEGVHVTQLDARGFFLSGSLFADDPKTEQITLPKNSLLAWISNPEVMMYLDPSYISAENEEKILREFSIKVDKVESVSEAIKAANKGSMPANLGSPYTASFSYEEQEQFLQTILKAKCQIMVSNYDLELYHKYLNESTGWRFERFETTTSVGGKRGNKRTEVVWMNY